MDLMYGIFLWLQTKRELNKAKLKLLQLQNEIGEVFTAELCELACTEVQKLLEVATCCI